MDNCRLMKEREKERERALQRKEDTEKEVKCERKVGERHFREWKVKEKERIARKKKEWKMEWKKEVVRNEERLRERKD